MLTQQATGYTLFDSLDPKYGMTYPLILKTQLPLENLNLKLKLGMDLLANASNVFKESKTWMSHGQIVKYKW